MVRRMRNDFAHSLERATLADDPHKNRVRELARDTRSSSLQSIVDPIFAAKKLPEELRDFCASLIVLITEIEITPGYFEFEVKRTPHMPAIFGAESMEQIKEELAEQFFAEESSEQ